jgi:hypothetical protein
MAEIEVQHELTTSNTGVTVDEKKRDNDNDDDDHDDDDFEDEDDDLEQEARSSQSYSNNSSDMPIDPAGLREPSIAIRRIGVDEWRREHSSRNSKEVLLQWSKKFHPTGRYGCMMFVGRDGQGANETKSKFYPRTRVSNRRCSVHRLAYFGTHPEQDVIKDYTVSHLCHNWQCVNEQHLTYELGSVNESRNRCQRDNHSTGCTHNPSCMWWVYQQRQ